MTKQLALIPVDARPVTYDLPKDLAKLAGWELLTPPKEILGFLKEPASLEKLQSWVNEVSPHIHGIIVSMDMILYGGLVPSRIHEASESQLHERLQNFLQIKRRYPHLKIMAFSSTMRISNNYVNQEEKDYWSSYGKEIWSYSYHTHRYETYGEEKDLQIIEQLEQVIPKHVLTDYLQTRKQNFNMNLHLLDLVEKGDFELLVFPQDDTSEFGLNIAEQQQLSENVFRRKLTHQVYIYPGADEVASVLTARMIFQLVGTSPPTFYPIYSGMNGSLSIAMYEDRSIQSSVIGQIHALGAHTVETPTEADVIFGVNVPGKRQGDLALQIGLENVDTNDRHIPEWMNKLQFYQKQGKAIAIADVAYANGADEKMMPLLLKAFSIFDLDGFAAWNTAGNTIGTVVAQAALIHLARKKQKLSDSIVQRQLLIRLLDDYLYQSIVRKQVRDVCPDESETQTLLQTVQTYFSDASEKILKQLSIDGYVDHIYLPWNRTFEIGFDVILGKNE